MVAMFLKQEHLSRLLSISHDWRFEPINICTMFSFSLVWAIGAITDLDGRVAFNSFLRTFIENEEYLNEIKSVKTALELKKW